MKHILPILVFSTTAVTSFSLLVEGPNTAHQQIAKTHASENRASTNPHWKRGGCAECHEATAGQLQAISRKNIDRTCLRCHNGRDAKREPHPIGRKFISNQVVQPHGWPDVDGKISCITCHDVVRACRKDANRPTRNARMLRGPASSDPLRFCATCHVEQLHELLNPHLMLAGDRSLLEDSCGYCHLPEISTHSPERRTNSAALLGDEITLCSGCHRQHNDYFEPGHIGARPSSVILRAMEHPSSQLQGSQAAQALLPLSQDGRLVCSTCHNPHQAGVFPEDSVLAAGAMLPAGVDNMNIGLRMEGSQICVACHSK